MEIVGNRHIIEPFVRAFCEERLANTYLIEGVEGSGKRTIVRYLSALLTCEHGEKTPCFSCRDCQNVLESSHPDVYEILPEEGKETISVEVVRLANRAALTAPIHAKKRIFIVPEAQKLSPAAQNALLKNLEEPRGDALYFLLCPDACDLLATIRSRAVIYRTQPIDETTVREYLSRHCPDADDQNLRAAAALCGGAIGKALEFIREKDLFKVRQSVLKYLELMMRGAGFDELCAALPLDTKKDTLPLLYRMLLSGLRDALCAAEGVSAREFFLPGEMIECRVSARKLSRVVDVLLELSDSSMANVGVATALLRLNSAGASE